MMDVDAIYAGMVSVGSPARAGEPADRDAFELGVVIGRWLVTGTGPMPEAIAAHADDLEPIMAALRRFRDGLVN